MSADTAGLFAGDGKDAGAMRTIGEVAQALGIKPHVLRYWEQQFPMLAPLKRAGGRRLYRAQDIALVERIDRLVNRQGYTLKGARSAIEAGEDPVREAPATAPDRAAIAASLRQIRQRLEAALDA